MRREKDAEQELKLARLAAQKEIKLLETSQNVRESSAPPAETFPKVSETFPRDSRNFQPQHWERLRGMVAVMTEADVATELGVTTKTVQNWKRKL